MLRSVGYSHRVSAKEYSRLVKELLFFKFCLTNGSRVVIRLRVTSLPLDSPPAVVEPFPGARVVAIFHSGVSTPPSHTATLGNNAYSQGFRKVYTSPQALLA